MSLLRLADHALFDPTDATGVIVDTRRGEYLSLNETGTIMLQEALRSATLDEALVQLRERIDAPDDTLRAGLDTLTQQLDRHALLMPQPGEPT